MPSRLLLPGHCIGRQLRQFVYRKVETMFSQQSRLGLLGLFVALVSATKKPNILFVLTDDQDWHMESLHYMPLLQKYLINEGTLFDRHYCTVSVCCPSRVNLWTGRAAHNTNVRPNPRANPRSIFPTHMLMYFIQVTDLFPPYGGCKHTH